MVDADLLIGENSKVSFNIPLCLKNSMDPLDCRYKSSYTCEILASITH